MDGFCGKNWRATWKTKQTVRELYARSIPGIFSSFSHVNGAAHASTNYMILFFFSFSRINGEQRIQVTTETGATPMAGERLYYNYKLTVAYRFINR